jgi:hypothetical protein
MVERSDKHIKGLAVAVLLSQIFLSCVTLGSGMGGVALTTGKGVKLFVQITGPDDEAPEQWLNTVLSR